jgi:hypothetical protein
MSTNLIHNPATAVENADIDEALLAQITFDNPVLEFGTVAAGRRIAHEFAFTNTGLSPLLIANVHSPCGCTVAKQWPKKAIAPGESGVIKVEFDSTDRIGHQDKKIDIVTNSKPSIIQVSLIGNVIGPDFN